jgi:hypothetical protein
MKIVFHYENPPIPIRCCDWSATLEGYDAGDPIGRGATPEEAEADLLEKLEERT